MDTWRLKLLAKIWGKKLGYIALISFISINVYRLNELGAFKNNFRTLRPNCGRVFGNLPLVGTSIKKWAYSGGRKYRRGRKGVSRRKGRRSRRRRSRRRRR